MCKNKSLKVLIGTLYSHENEYQSCISSVENQSYPYIHHFTIDGLPNKEAHTSLFQTFMKNGSEFDIYIKLDADMVFSSPQTVSDIVGLFQANKKLWHAKVPVLDWYTNTFIKGLHIFRSGSKWVLNDNVFVDPDPCVLGSRKTVWSLTKNPILHSPNPSRKQAYIFGVHKAIKVKQAFHKRFRIIFSNIHWRNLRLVYRKLKLLHDPRLALALIGAIDFLTQDVIRDFDYNDPYYTDRFDEYKNMNIGTLISLVDDYWSSIFSREKFHWQIIESAVYPRSDFLRLITEVDYFLREIKMSLEQFATLSAADSHFNDTKKINIK